MKINPMSVVAIFLVVVLGWTAAIVLDIPLSHEPYKSEEVRTAKVPKSGSGVSSEVDLDALQREYDEAVAAVGFERPSGHQIDPVIVNGMHRNVEAMEFACKKYGSTCAEAQFLRKQYEDILVGR